MASIFEDGTISQLLKNSLQETSILLIDDRPEARMVLRNMLSVCELKRIKEAGSAMEAVKVLENLKADIVLSDYNLGDSRDGQQLYEELMERKLVSEATVYIMITGERTYERVVRAAELAPDDYILKPFTPAILYSRIERAFIKKTSLLPVLERMAASDWEGAIQECDKQLLNKPKHPLELFRLKGEALLALGKLDDAEALYLQVLASYKLPWADYGRARIARMRGKLLLAVSKLEEIIEDAPYFIKAHDELADVYEEMGDIEKAEKVLEKANEVSPNSVKRQKKLAKAAFFVGKLGLAENVLNNIVDKCKFSMSHDASDYALLGKTLAQQGKAEEGLSTLSAAVKFFGASDVTTITQMSGQANLYFGANQFDKARNSFNRAKALYEDKEPKLPEQILMDLAESAVRHNDIAFCNKLLALLPKGDAFSGLAQARMIAAMFDRAGRTDLAENLVAASKQEVTTLNNAAVLAAREKKYDEAMPTIRRAAQALPEDLRVVSNMVKVLMAMVRDQGYSEELNKEVLEGLEGLHLISESTEKELRDFYSKLCKAIGAPGAA